MRLETGRENPELSGLSKKEHALDILRELRAHGFEAYFVGGCVRDLLLKKAPKDFDIATSATPPQVQKLFPKTVPVGAQFGVMLVVKGDHPFEVATFRADKGYQDGRRPTAVAFTNAKEDAVRRDFTVNGLFMDPLGKKVLDWVEGKKDLKRKLIRAIGDPRKRFSEDKLRMLRAVRFASVLGFKIEPRTLAALKKFAPQIKTVSNERVRDELVKMFTGPRPALALELLDKSGLLKHVLPEVEKMKGVQQPKAYHPEGDVFKHTKLLLEQLSNADLTLAFGALLHDVGKPPTFRRADRIRFNGHESVGARMTEDILTRLRFSNEDKARIVACVEGHMRFKDVKQMKVSTLKKMMQRETYETELEQHRIDCLASHGDLSNWKFLKKKAKELSRDQIRPEPLLRGQDLIEMGYKPGPQMGQILRALEEAQLEGKVQTADEARSWARSSYRPS
jgi:putative nucleotidyltransferase with HDIG domain